tara:strand:- start:39 stop:389 length:351 start_codon:yes stop_codon:yes gene_type:complete
MRHKKGNKKLSKPTDQRIALLRSLSLSLINHSKIKTTDLRAKEAQKYVEKLITLSKTDSVHSRRQALKLLPNKDAIKVLFNSIGKNYQSKQGGYTKITKLGFRKGDSSPISLLEFA